MNILDASCRVAFAAMTHDLGKFAQRADKTGHSRFPQDKLDGNTTLYCRFHEAGGYHSHKHAAYTALAFDELEGNWPDVIRDETAPFASRKKGEDITDSLINAAAAHHKPDTLLQWIIAVADRTSSGFERKKFEEYNRAEDKTDTGRNHYQARLLSLFEQILQLEKAGAKELDYRYPLKPMSAEGIFPKKRKECEPDNNSDAQAEYQNLWQAFVGGLGKIPASHRKSWPLWLDHFDSLWLAFTHAIPSATAFGVKPDVSLYDHSKATAALAVALWRWELNADRNAADAVVAMRERTDWDEQKFLLVQGDFFGIQDFIFADGGETNKRAAKILRGRSFQVSLFTELAALRVLEALELPATSQINNAAGKFLIVAPNTSDTVENLQKLRHEFDDWFLKISFGMAGIGLAWKAASCNDFCGRPNDKSRFAALMKTLFENQEKAKYQRFDLCRRSGVVLKTDFSHGVCAWNGKLPADSDAEQSSCALSRDQILIGECLVQYSRILVVKKDSRAELAGKICELTPFGYILLFAENEDTRGKFGALAAGGALRRCWDFDPPQTMSDTLWNGYARRHINAHTPRFAANEDLATAADKYGKNLAEEIAPKMLKTLNHIACEDRRHDDDVKKWIGQAALTVLKGDVDDLGLIFKKVLENSERGQKPTFAKMAALSRQMNAFFAVYLPALCKSEYPNTYTVFAGGDDFFLIGPWFGTQQLAAGMAKKFSQYTAENPKLHFSAGMVMTKPGAPIRFLAEQADDALDKAKKLDGKNAFCLFDAVESWKIWPDLAALQDELERLKKQYKLSTGFVYSLLSLLDLSLRAKEEPSAAIWRSRLVYRVARMTDTLKQTERDRARRDIITVLSSGIEKHGSAFLTPLYNHLYLQR